jgi:nitronate monooxygenase
MKTRITELLRIEHPVIQAPMAGISTPELAAAVSNAGGLGSISAGAVDADVASKMISDLRAATDQPFHVNFFAHQSPTRDRDREMTWLRMIGPLFETNSLSPPDHLNVPYHSFLVDERQLDLVLNLRPPVVSFHFGLPTHEQVSAMRGYGLKLLAAATSVDEAVACERAGMDAVIVQGFEAGGHRGVHNGNIDQQTGLFALLPHVANAVSIPLIAAGGVANGRGIAAAFALGAEGVQIGTAFVACPESSATEAHRAALVSRSAHGTIVTSGVSGRVARGFASDLLRELALHEDSAPDYPVAYDAAKAISAAARRADLEGYEIMWAGQAAPLSRALPAAELLRELIEDAAAQFQELNRFSTGSKKAH